MTVDDKKIIYSMVGVGKTFGQQTVLKNISLSYFYGAKIGVLGHNGSGKSTLLKIMAGVEHEFRERHTSLRGIPSAILNKSLSSETALTVKEVVSEGLGEVSELLQEFEKNQCAICRGDVPGRNGTAAYRASSSSRSIG